MKLIHYMLLRYMLPIFLFSLLFFVLMIEIVDLFTNLVQYQRLEVPLGEIFKVQLLYLPKCISYSLPIALLFATSVSVSMLYANNELITIFSSGIPIYSLTVPIIIIGVLLSFFGFFFDELYVIESFRQKNEQTKTLLRSNQSYNNANVAVRTKDQKMLYYVDYYNDDIKTFSDITIIEFDDNNNFYRRLDAHKAQWNADRKYWLLQNVSIYTLDSSKKIIHEKRNRINNTKYNMPPDAFQFREWKMEELTLPEARDALLNLRSIGRDHREELTSYYSRFSFAVTPMIVVLISCSLAGKFKKHVILMTLLFSLSIAVVYYVFRSITTIMASNAVLTPFIGAWLASFVFLVISVVLYKQAST